MVQQNVAFAHENYSYRSMPLILLRAGLSSDIYVDSSYTSA